MEVYHKILPFANMALGHSDFVVPEHGENHHLILSQTPCFCCATLPILHNFDKFFDFNE